MPNRWMARCDTDRVPGTEDRTITEFIKTSRFEEAAEGALTQNTRFQVYTERHLDRIKPLQKLDAEQRFAMQVVSRVLPFRVNQYVIDELIDWDRVPEDPIFQLTFPQQGMLAPEDFTAMADALRSDAEPAAITRLARQIRARLTPHPAGQQRLHGPALHRQP